MLILLLCSYYVSAQINDSIPSIAEQNDIDTYNKIDANNITIVDSPKLLTEKGVYIINYIGANYDFPDEALEDGISGIMIVVFIVEKDGSVKNVTVEKKLCDACDTEAIRVIKSTKYQIYKENGEPKRIQYRIPVRLLSE